MRPLLFGNGRLLICEDELGIIRDIYYPYVGLENHCNMIRAGIYDANLRVFSWLDGWGIQQRYKSSFEKNFFETLEDLKTDDRENMEIGFCASNIGETIFENQSLGLRVRVLDAVHPSSNYFYRLFDVMNISPSSRDIGLFSNQNYNILENKIGETAFVDGDMLIHYKRDRYFLHSSYPQFDQYAVGVAEWKGMQGTWKDMEEDGMLSCNAVAHGSIDSTISWRISGIRPGESRRIHMWIVVGRGHRQVVDIHRKLKENGPANVYRISFNFWKAFIEHVDALPECRNLRELPEKVQDAFYRSLMATVAHMDVNGSIIASCDSEIKQFGADLYTYCWPRDASWACIALDRARYHHLSKEIIDFLSKIITVDGYFLHKYTPAGDFGSTWHPVPMIQLDETGLPLYALYHNWLMSKDVWIIGRYFSSLVRPAAEFLVGSIDRTTNLPAESFDLWEERRGSHAYTAAVVHAGLRGASEIARILGNEKFHSRWSQAAELIRHAALDLYDDSIMHFRRSPSDSTLDASVFSIWYFELLPANDPRVVNTMRAIERELTRPSGGVARYMHDTYHGYMNSWLICTLWLAQWHIAVGNLDRALELIKWCSDHTFSTGLMPEQVSDDNTFRSVLPLMWSHCTFVLAVLEYLRAVSDNQRKE